MKDRSFKIVTIVALLIAVLGLSIGYATYTERLKISGTVAVKASSNAWDVHFENISAASFTGIANEMVSPDLTSTIISKFEVNFFAPGDSVSYTFDVVNKGLLNAKLTTFSKGSLSCEPSTNSTATATEANALCRDLTYTLTYADGSDIKTGDLLYAGDSNNTKSLKVTIGWKNDSTISLKDDVLVTIGATNFIYTQA